MKSYEIYRIVQQIRQARGLMEKKAILTRCPEMRNMLRSAYDPFIHFNIVVPDSWIDGSGVEHFSPKTSSLLNNLRKGAYSGNRAKKEIKMHMAELEYESACLLALIINKDFRFGLGAKSINDVFPGLISSHDIQLAKLFELGRCSFPCFTSPKLDGLRALYRDGGFFSRNGNRFKGLEDLEASMRVLAELMGDAVYDGELMVDGEHFNEISGKLRSFSKTDNAIYNIFDMLTDEPQFQRLARLNARGLRIPDYVIDVLVVPHYTCTTIEDVLDWDGKFREEGYEGSMVKAYEGLYQGKRTWDWMKIKSVETEDCEVIGVFEGRGKYAGACGGIIVSFNGVAVRVGGGLSDLQRHFWFEKPHQVVGQMAEVAFQEVTPDGSMRHPRLITLRGDK